MAGKTIRVFLVDGTPSGILTAEIGNWTGKAVVAPRARLGDLATRPEVRKTGVYCLVGEDPIQRTKERVYVGEGDNVFSRLKSHDADAAKDFWIRTIIITSKDENLTKAHGRYLESRLIKLANVANRAIIENGTAPPSPPLPESDVDDMEFFLGYIQLMLPVLGFGFLQPTTRVIPITAADRDMLVPFETTNHQMSPMFVLRQKEVGAIAKAQEVDGEMVVQKGSTARKNGVESWSSYKSLRDQLVAEQRLVDTDSAQLLIFNEDIAFPSPSAAAAVVLARNANGRIEWREEISDRTYQDWKNSINSYAERKNEIMSSHAITLETRNGDVDD